MATGSLIKPMSFPTVFDDFFKPWDEMFDRSYWKKTSTMPPVNITENEKFYILFLAVPGLKKEDLKIDLSGNLLTVAASIQEEKEEKEEAFTRKEFNFTSFSRSFTLPEGIYEEAIEARYENGVLKLMLPKKEASKNLTASKKIAVK